MVLPVAGTGSTCCGLWLGPLLLQGMWRGVLLAELVAGAV